MLTQAEYIRHFNEENREEFNDFFFQRDNEKTAKAIEQVVRSCERDKYFTLKVLSFEVIYDYEEIYNTLRNHEEKRRKKNSKLENSYNYINIKDSDIFLVKIEWLVRHNGVERQEVDGKTIEVVNPEEVLEVLIALPRFVKGYYFRLKGNYYTSTFQIVDGSTYNNSTSSRAKVDTVTMKDNFMSIRIFRSFRDMVDVGTKQTIKVIEYNSIIFNNVCNAMYYLLAHFGLYGLSDFLGIDCVTVGNAPYLHDDYLNFEKHGIYITCPKVCFEDPVVQSLCATLYSGISKDATVNDLFNIRYWLKNLGQVFKNSTIDKGLFVLDSVDGIYDLITKNDLHLPDEIKDNIYNILTWLIKEFSNLRAKDNVDVRTKRIRLYDYIAQAYGMKLNIGMHRISDMGRKVTLKKVIQAIYTQPMFVLNSLSNMTNLVSYRDMVNDNDATVALKWTYKGISGLGEDGNSVQPIYRYVDPSHVGILDLDSSSGSDPGMTGMICPMAQITDNSFSEYDEPVTWDEQFATIMEKYKKGKTNPLEFTGEIPKPSFYDIREQIVAEELDLNRITCPVFNDDPSILYTCSEQIIEQNREEQKKQFNLFTIIDKENE